MFFTFGQSWVAHALIPFLQQSNTNSTHQSLSLLLASWQGDATFGFSFSQQLDGEEVEWLEARALPSATPAAVG